MDWPILSGILLAGIALLALFVKMHRDLFASALTREFDRLIEALNEFRRESKSAAKANRRRITKLKKREDKRDTEMLTGLATLQATVADLTKIVAAQVAADAAEKLHKTDQKHSAKRTSR